MANPLTSKKIIALTGMDEYHLTTEENIICCDSNGNYTDVHLSDGNKITISKKLKEVENTLASAYFIRIHHSHLINLIHAKKFIKKDGTRILLDNGRIIDVSRSRRKSLLEKLNAL